MFKPRKAVKKDVPGILSLIRELALYEKAPDEVTVTEKILEEDGFGENPVYHAIVIEDSDSIIGLALYYVSYSTWKGKCIYLEDLIVTEKFRGKGLGDILFREMIKISGEFGAARLSWQVLDWNKPAINFYKKYDSTLDPTWINGTITSFNL